MGEHRYLTPGGYADLDPDTRQRLAELGLNEADVLVLADQRQETVADTADYLARRYAEPTA